MLLSALKKKYPDLRRMLKGAIYRIIYRDFPRLVHLYHKIRPNILSDERATNRQWVELRMGGGA